jgi:Zn-dependent protease
MPALRPPRRAPDEQVVSAPVVLRDVAEAAWACPRCAAHVAPALLACPSCRTLQHADALKRLATEADESERAGDALTAHDRWRDALALLPPESGQYATVQSRIEALAPAAERLASAGVKTRAPATPDEPAASAPAKREGISRGGMGAALFAVAALLLKFKWVVVFALTKGKLLLLGLSKGSTVLSMLASFGVYWTLWGWRFAAGFVLSIYVHEMGHVAALRRRGVPASAPMFIPLIGAFVRLHQHPRTEWEDADVGLAGPVWGLGAALAAYGAFLATGAPVWAAIAKTGAMINLFNLTPVWQLDGARGFRAMSRTHRIAAVVVVLAAFALAREAWLLLPAIAGAWQCFQPAAKRPDVRAVALYAALIAAFAALLHIPLAIAR